MHFIISECTPALFWPYFNPKMRPRCNLDKEFLHYSLSCVHFKKRMLSTWHFLEFDWVRSKQK